MRQTAARGLRGLEAGVGIPGSLGGVLTMNAGAYEFSIGERVERVEAVSPERGVVTLARDEIDFRYRASSFGPGLIVASVTLALTPDDPLRIRADVERHMRLRKETQPVGVEERGVHLQEPRERVGGAVDRPTRPQGISGRRRAGLGSSRELHRAPR